MARARNIKPGFFKNADLVELTMEARLLFIGLWTLADRAGRLEDRPKQIKMELFPADMVDVDDCLDGLQRWGFVKRYEVGGRRLLQVVNFNKHQNPHRDEKVSALPAEDGTFDAPRVKAQGGNDDSTMRARCEDDAGTVGIGLIPDSLIPESGLLIPESGFQDIPPPPAPVVAAAKPAKVSAEDDPAFMAAWQAYPRRPGDSRAEAFKAWRARLKEGFRPEDMAAGVARYAAYVVAMRTEPQYVKQGATFFGPHQHFTAEWELPASRGGGGGTADVRAKTTAGALRLLNIDRETIDA